MQHINNLATSQCIDLRLSYSRNHYRQQRVKHSVSTFSRWNCWRRRMWTLLSTRTSSRTMVMDAFTSPLIWAKSLSVYIVRLRRVSAIGGRGFCREVSLKRKSIQVSLLILSQKFCTVSSRSQFIYRHKVVYRFILFHFQHLLYRTLYYISYGILHFWQPVFHTVCYLVHFRQISYRFVLQSKSMSRTFL